MSNSKSKEQKFGSNLNLNTHFNGDVNNNRSIQFLEKKSFKQDSIRLNIINKQDRFQKISIIVNSSLLISHLKRKIQNEYSQAQNVHLLIRTVEDQNGFIFSNNSSIGQYVQSGQTIYIQIQRNKKGSNMNLPNNISDLFVTLRYVSSSIVQKLDNLKVQLSPSDLISELLHLGYWKSNSQIVVSLIKLLKKSAQTQLQLLNLRQNQSKIHQLFGLLSFWLLEIENSFFIYPDICYQIIQLLQKLTKLQVFQNYLKNSRLIKLIVQQSKNINQSNQVKKCCMDIIKNINKSKNSSIKGINLNKLQYVPTIFEESSYSEFNLQDALDMLNSNSQDLSLRQKALQILSKVKNKLVLQSTITLQNYWKLLQGLLKIKRPTQKKIMVFIDSIYKELIDNTSYSRCIQLSNRNILKQIHNYLLQASPQLHKYVFNFTKFILQEGCKKGELSIANTVQYINSPYNQIQLFVCQSLQKNCENEIKNNGNYIRYLSYIKDFIKLSLKTQNQQVSKSMLKILSMICLEEQCRFQVVNLKGIQVFIKCLLSAHKTKSIQIQRACGKGLLNLAVSSKQTKTKILSLMQDIIQLYYKNSFDSVTQGYIQTLLKPINKF